MLFDVFKHLPLRKADALKTCQKSKFLGKKIWRNALALRSTKVQAIFGKTFILAYYLQLSFLCKVLSQIYFKLFYSGDKRLLSEYLTKWGWFLGYNERFHKYLGEKLKFQKPETRFCRCKSTDNNDINIFISLENPCTFLLAKEKTWTRIFNTNTELSQNRTENKFVLQNNSKLAI